ncbi:hypothetical protein HYV85_00830, partial [Candidatus Woesearchaeota archaeon]|nr:hypothetical protein [Candidatus Woesearchaeota archaeon]
MLAQSGLRRKVESYISNLALVWLALAFYRTNSYYAGFLRPETQQVLLWMALAYTALGLLFHVIIPFRHVNESKGATLIRMLWRLSRETKAYIANFTLNPSRPMPKIDQHEKTVLLFVLVKVFFLPLMLNFLFNSLNN